MSSRVRDRAPRLGAVGPVLALADVGGVLLVGGGARLVDAWPWVPSLLAALVAGVVARVVELHRSRLRLSVLEDLPGLLVTSLAATTVLLVAGGVGEGRGPDGVGPAAVLTALLVVVLAALHALVHGVARALRRAGRLRRVVVVGCGASGRRLALTLLARPEFGLVPVGFLSTGDDTRRPPRGLPLTLLGRVADLPRALADARAEAILVALPAPAADVELDAVDERLEAGADVYAVPAHFPPAAARARPHRERVGGLAVVRLDGRHLPGPVRAGKRLVEVIVAVAALLVLVPVAAVIAVLVRIETGGVLVRRPRVDEAGLPSVALRFRSRRARSLARPGTTWSVAISGRIGPVGRVLRWTRLNHLPELVRVLALRLRRHRGPAWEDVFRSAAAPSADEPQVDAGQLAG
jgi:hypothetical protein